MAAPRFGTANLVCATATASLSQALAMCRRIPLVSSYVRLDLRCSLPYPPCQGHESHRFTGRSVFYQCLAPGTAAVVRRHFIANVRGTDDTEQCNPRALHAPTAMRMAFRCFGCSSGEIGLILSGPLGLVRALPIPSGDFPARELPVTPGAPVPCADLRPGSPRYLSEHVVKKEEYVRGHIPMQNMA